MNEAIEMQRKRVGFFPRTFLWRGRRYEVRSVDRSWTIDTQRHYFRVRCPEGAFELFQDIAHNTWHVTRFEPAGQEKTTQSQSGDGVQQGLSK